MKLYEKIVIHETFHETFHEKISGRARNESILARLVKLVHHGGDELVELVKARLPRVAHHFAVILDLWLGAARPHRQNRAVFEIESDHLRRGRNRQFLEQKSQNRPR